MVLPLVGCTGNATNDNGGNTVPPVVDDGGNEGGNEGGGNEGGGSEGGNEGGQGGQQDPVEVKQTELLDTLKTIAKNVFGEEEVEGTDYWDEQNKLYGVYECSMKEKSDSYRWENGLDQLKAGLPTSYTVKEARTEVTYNDAKAVKESYLVSGKIQVDAWAYTVSFDGPTGDWVYLDFEIKAGPNTTFVDDIVEELKTATVSFTNSNDFTGDFSSTNKDTFITFFNNKVGADVLRDVVVKLRNHPIVEHFEVDCEAFESIHNHNAFAKIEWPHKR